MTDNKLQDFETSAPLEGLLTDGDVAQLTGMSRGWVRAQRHYRKHGKPHTFEVDPIHLGRSARYSRKAVFEWLDGMIGEAN